MNTWYSVDLGDGVEAFLQSKKILDAFFLAFAIPGHPENMAAFSRYDLEANMVTEYFTPAAHSIAKMFNATPCKKPSSDDLSLHAGEWGCWQTFFPERVQSAIQRLNTIND